MSSARNPSGEVVSGHFARPIKSHQGKSRNYFYDILHYFGMDMSERCFSISNECCIIILSKVNRFEINKSIDHFLKMLFTTEKKKENLF